MTAAPAATVLVVSHYYPPHLGGVENVARSEAEQLAEAGHRVEVLTTSPGATAGTRLENGVRVHRVRAWNGIEDRIGVPFPVPSPGLFLAAARSVRRARVVHVHDALYVTSWLAAFWCLVLRRRLVVTQHVDLVAHPRAAVRAVQRLVYGTAGRCVLRAAAVVIVLNGRVRAFADALTGGRTRVELIPNAVDAGLYHPPADDAERNAARRRFGLAPGEIVAVFAGRFVPKKGYDVLLDARTPAVRLVLAGGPPARGAPPPGGCTVLGPAAPADLAVLYRAADLFVLPSVSEGFPLTVQEAMASGLPVVTTDDPAYACYGLDPALVALVPPEPGPVREQLERLAADAGLRARMGAYSLSFARERFGRPAHLAALHAAYGLHAGGPASRAGAPASAGEAAEGHGLAGDRERPLRVAVVTPYYPPRLGGVERYAQRVVAALEDQPDAEPLVITTRRGVRTVVEQHGRTPVIRVGAWIRWSNTPVSPLWPWTVWRLLRRHRVDVVNAHSPVPLLADVAVLVSGRRPVVLTYHAGSLVKGYGRADRALRWYEQRVLPRLFDRADALVAVSPASLAWSTGRAVLITPGVDAGQFRPPHPPVPREPVLLYVGRMERSSSWKGVGLLIEALATVRGIVPGAVLDLVGSGDAQSDLAELARRRGVREAVRFRGELSGDDLVQAYQRAAVLALPSLTDAESFGMVLTEAMACATPVVGTQVGGVPFVLRDGQDGLLVPPGDPDALADACVLVLTDPAAARSLGQAGRRAAVTRFAWPERMSRTVELIRTAGAARADAVTRNAGRGR